MKRISLVLVAILMSVMSFAKENLEFAYSAQADIVSSFLWRGTYSGGLSFQPGVEIGWESENTNFAFGAWGNIGAEDWTFKKNSTCDYDKSGINPELDLYLSFNLWGATFGITHYYYFGKYSDDYKFFGGEDSQTEINVGVDFDNFLDIPLTLTWNTIVAGGDADTLGNRAWSSYFEAVYSHSFDKGFGLEATLGFTPWKSLYTNYEGGFAVNQIALKVSKEFQIKDICTMSIWALGSLNTYNIGRDPGDSAVRGCIGYSLCF